MNGYQGVGGAFLYAEDPAALATWYRQMLGVPLAEGNWVELPSADRSPAGRSASTTFAIMKADGALPATRAARLNHRVADLDAVVAHLRAHDVEVTDPEDDYGRFAWCVDPEGHRVELWEPPAEDALAGPVDVVPAGKRLATAGVMSPDELVKEVVVEATPAELWPLWTTREGMMSWLISDCRIELRIGGPFELYFMPEGDNRGSDGCTILSFLPHRMLSFTWNAPPQHPETRPQHTWIVVEFEPTEGGTRVRLTHTGWPVDVHSAPWNETHAYFDVAWGHVLGKLQQHVAS